jgi:hypothetical protein
MVGKNLNKNEFLFGFHGFLLVFPLDPLEGSMEGSSLKGKWD